MHLMAYFSPHEILGESSTDSTINPILRPMEAKYI